MKHTYVMEMNCDTSKIFAPGAIDEIQSASSNADFADCTLMVDSNYIRVCTVTEEYAIACGRFMRCLCNQIIYGKLTDIGIRMIGDLGSCMGEFASSDMTLNGMKSLTVVDKRTSTMITNIRISKNDLPIEEKKAIERSFIPDFDPNVNLTDIPHPPKIAMYVSYLGNNQDNNGVCGLRKYDGSYFSTVLGPLYTYGIIYSHMMAMFQGVIGDIVMRYADECSASIIKQSKINGIDMVEYNVRHAIAVAKEFTERNMPPETPGVCYEHPVVMDTVIIHNGNIAITAEINWKETYE